MKIKETKSLRMNPTDPLDFINSVISQYDKNEQKWGFEHDNAKDIDSWNEIFQEQADQLAAAIIVGDPKGIREEIIHTTAIALEMFRHVKEAGK